MDGINGMNTAKHLRAYDDNVKIIFITSSADFTLESYGVFAYGYLVNPICEKKFNHFRKDAYKNYVKKTELTGL